MVFIACRGGRAAERDWRVVFWVATSLSVSVVAYVWMNFFGFSS